VTSCSFIIPALNEEALIAGCLRSIIYEVDRAGIRAEVIVVDNGSTDQTAGIARVIGGCAEISVHVLYELQKGITYARQRGADAARYDVLAFIDADNVLPEGWLAVILHELEHPGVVAVSGPLVYRELSWPLRKLSWAFYAVAWLSHRTVGPMLQGGNYAVRGAALRAAGGHDTGIEFFGEDTATAIRLARVGKVRFSMGLWAYSSARRFEREGLVLTTARYVINYLWITFAHRPYTTTHVDVRPNI
jgi:glycosyltransferase involved in cell wall biosynthesis